MRITEAASLPPLPPIDLHQCSGRCYCACYACCYSREEDAPVGQVKGRFPILQKLADPASGSLETSRTPDGTIDSSTTGWIGKLDLMRLSDLSE